MHSKKRDVNLNKSRKRVHEIQFGVVTAEDAEKISFVNVQKVAKVVPGNTSALAQHYAGSPLDLKLGSPHPGKEGRCQNPYCKNKHGVGNILDDCPGHFGSIRLPLPVFNTLFCQQIKQTLQCICKTCSRILLDDFVLQSKLKKARKLVTVEDKKAHFKTVMEAAKKNLPRTCPHCGAMNGKVDLLKKIYRFVHKKFDGEEFSLDKADLLEEAEHVIKDHADVRQRVMNKKVADDLYPTRVYQLFEAMTSADAMVLGFGDNRPEDMLLSVLVVPPLTIRPTVSNQRKQVVDDLTVIQTEIIQVSTELEKAMRDGDIHEAKFFELYDELQLQVSMYLDFRLPHWPKKIRSDAKKKEYRSLAQRLRQKPGRFRKNLCGKRVNYSARTVISPDPNLKIFEVGIPEEVAKKT